MPVLVVAAYRDTRFRPAAGLPGNSPRIVEASAASVVPLGGLEAGDVAGLIDRYAGPVDDPVSGAVAERTNGNPLFVIEVARLLRGAADKAQIAAAGLPPTVLALIAGRVERLPPECRHALEAAAVLGRDFGRMPLSAVLALSEIAVAAALQPAAMSRLIGPGPGGTYRFTHALVQSAVYESVPLDRRADLHRRAALAIERAGGDEDERLSDLAFHSFHAAVDGDARSSLVHVLVAGRQAVRRLAFDEASAWLARAVELGQRVPLPAAEAVEIQLELAAAERDAGETAAARRRFEAAADIARTAVLPGSLARAALGVGTTVVTAGKVDWDLVRLLEEAVEGATSPSDRARLESRLAIELYWHDGGEPARAMSHSALATAEASGDPSVVGVALHAMQFTLRSPEHLAERIAIGYRLVSAAEATRQLDLEFQGRLWLAADVLRAADVARFRRLVASLDAIATRTRLPLQRWYALVMLAQQAAIEGRFDDAERLTDEAGALGGRLGTELAPAYRLGQRCVLRRERGGLDGMVTDIDEMSTRLPYFITIRSFAALAASVGGRFSQARLEIDRLSADRFAAVPRDSLWVATIALLTEAAAISGSPHLSTLAALLAPHQGTLVVNGLPNCWGSCDRFLGRAQFALGDLDAATEHLRAAEALESSAGLPVHLARTRLDLARLAQTRGEEAERRRLLAEVRDVASSLRLDALVREASEASDDHKPLTRRETEVLARVSRGETNKEIAASLYISVNTVERHLANIYTKLGVRSRIEALLLTAEMVVCRDAKQAPLPHDLQT